MGFEERSSPSTTPERNVRQRQVKSMPAAELYKPPAARRASKCVTPTQTTEQPEQIPLENYAKSTRQKRPDRAVYVPLGRRSNLEPETSPKTPRDRVAPTCPKSISPTCRKSLFPACPKPVSPTCQKSLSLKETTASDQNFESKNKSKGLTDLGEFSEKTPIQKVSETNEIVVKECELKVEKIEESSGIVELSPTVKTMNERNMDVEVSGGDLEEVKICERVLKISEVCQTAEEKKVPEVEKVLEVVATLEKKVQKVEKAKSKTVMPTDTLKVKCDDADWESLFDDNGECLDQSLIDELSSAVGEVMIEQPKSTYQGYKRPVEVSTDEFAHVIEIYNFPSEFKTCDLGMIFTPFRNAGFELKWVDDTHCLGVCGSPLVAAEVLASDHPFVKTRPLSEATALSKTKARQSPDCLRIHKPRPETCAALARRLVTGALGVRLATATQEREQEKIILREAKERRRLANKQRDDIWEGVYSEK